MATSDSGGQQHVSRTAEETEETSTETGASEELATRKEQLDQEVQELVDAIEKVLEDNPEEFVKSYVQKGGE